MEEAMRAQPQLLSLMKRIMERINSAKGGMTDDARSLSEMTDLLIQYKHFGLLYSLFSNRPMVVQGGIFEGLVYDPPIFEGSLFPRLLGTYEANLQPHILELKKRSYETILNIGCAEGFYASGLGRMFPDAVIHAYEIQDYLRDACAVVATDNGLQSRFYLGKEFVPNQSEVPSGRRTLLFCDIEGGEFTLLNMTTFPQIANMDMVVEIHPGADRTLDEFVSRFVSTHDIEIVDLSRRVVPAPPAIRGIGDINQLLSICEFRGSETPWVVLRSRTLGH
jgi:hypothetical protein